MWRLVKAEFSYNRINIVVAFLFISIFLYIMIYDWPGPLKSFTFSMWFAYVGESVGIGIFIRSAKSRKHKEKRERMHVLLPLSTKQIALSRIVLPILFWMGFIFWFWLNILIFRGESIDMTIAWVIFAITGHYLCFNAAIYINYDLDYYLIEKRKAALQKIISICWIVVLVSLLLLFFMGVLDREGPSLITSLRDYLFFSLWGAFGFLAIGLLSTCLSIIIFMKPAAGSATMDWKLPTPKITMPRR